MAREDTILVVGRGEVFFDLFEPGTRVGSGERYFGNTTTFQVGRTLEQLERATAYKGQKITTKPSVISESHTVNFITDHIDMENVGLWFGLESSEVTLLGVNVITEHWQVRPGRFIQLGTSVQPFGVRNIENVIVKIGATLVPMAGNYSIEKEWGRLEVLKGSELISADDTLDITFEWRTTKSVQSTSQAKNIYGSMRFMATNPYGPRKHYFFPMVKLSPRGAMDLKGDEWQQIPFQVDVMRINPITEQVYFEEVLQVTTTQDEQAIIDFGGISLAEFPLYEGILDNVVNVLMPQHDL